ncbi:flagellar filament capping protein FliD [Janthinobacterium sp.]|uniref:flagellar filament capping protein FliD n=1 Tax=Janthinobacterium sp. TaxID=1871054 RepID=UPI00293D529B|nr:flagellar filament capping protein FliD [Janthinobacterium sp.]
MASTAPVPYNVDTSAKAWTDKYSVDRQTLITNQTATATARAKGLTSLKAAITAYQSSLSAMSVKKTVLAQAATFDNPSLGSATAGPTAVPGNYSFFVDHLATTNQVSISGLTGAATPAAGTGTLSIKVGSQVPFTVDLQAADTDGAAGLTAKEIAAAINAAPHDSSKVTASVINIGGSEQLVLTSGTSGAAGNISLSAPDLQAGHDDALIAALGAPQQVVPAQDALIWLGAKGTGIAINQSSNTFTGITGVSMTFTKAQAATDPLLNVTVGLDATGTTANAQGFVDSYNKLKSLLDTLTDPGDPQKGTAPGPYYGDSGMRVLGEQMVRTLRESSVGSLSTYGITSNRDGVLTLNAAKLTSALARNPAGLDTAIGSNLTGASSGVVGKLDQYLKLWTSAGTGQLAQREASMSKLQTSLDKKQADFESDYVAMFNKYKMQFTQLNILQSQMAQNTDLFDALFGNKN